jgi:hypothetical protein
MTEFEAAGHHLMAIIQCGHTMCSVCFENGGFMKRLPPNRLKCPVCRVTAPIAKVFGTRVFLNIQ